METALMNEVWKSEFITRISHEMRTPLTSIIGYAEVMLSDPRLPSEAKEEYVTIIRDAGKRLSRFLDAYIESEVFERNRRLAESRGEDISALANQAVERVIALAMAKGVTIEVLCDPATFIEESAPENLVQIFENILRNAIAIAPVAGHLEVRATRQDKMVKIEILNRDHGLLSLSATAVAKDFRWIQSPGIEICHDGLGLAFAKHIVELEGGLLNVLTNEEGLAFTLQFPHTSKKY